MKKNIYMYIQGNHFAVEQKLTHYKSTIFQYNKFQKKKKENCPDFERAVPFRTQVRIRKIKTKRK